MWMSKTSDFLSTASVAASRRTSSTSSLGKSTSTTSKRIPAATTTTASVFVSKTNRATPSSYQVPPHRGISFIRTLQPTGNGVPALSMLSAAAGINQTPSTGISSNYSAVDDSQRTRLNNDDDASHTEDEDRYEEEFSGEAGDVVHRNGRVLTQI
jgi:hypothetical protein